MSASVIRSGRALPETLWEGFTQLRGAGRWKAGWSSAERLWLRRQTRESSALGGHFLTSGSTPLELAVWRPR